MRRLLLLAMIWSALAVWPLAQTADDPVIPLPPYAQEVEGKQIGWFRNQTREAFVEAVYREVPLVLVIGEPTPGSVFVRFMNQVLPCPHVNRLAGVAVFAYAYPSVDADATNVYQTLAKEHNIGGFPLTAVLEPRTDNLVMRFGMEGFFDGQTVMNDLAQKIWPADKRLPLIPYPPGWPQLTRPLVCAPAPTP